MAASPSRYRRSNVPSSRRIVARTKSAAPRAASAYFGSSRIAASFREGRNHQAVPRGQNLVVEMRSRAFGACLEQRMFRGVQRCGHLFDGPVEMMCRLFHGMGLEQNVPAGELMVRIVRDIAVWFHAVAESPTIGRDPLREGSSPPASTRCKKRPRSYGRARGVDRAVGILSRIKSAVRRGHIAHDVIERAPRRARQGRVLR